MADNQWWEFDSAARQFLDDLRRSELVEDWKVDDVLLNLDPQRQPEISALALLTCTLVERRLLTSWQIDKLLRRKFRGFIVGDLVITEHLNSNSQYARYKAHDKVRN